MDLNVLDQPAKTPLLDVVRVIFLRGDEVLLVQESDDINWKLPGGKIHAGETIFEALQREIQEELGYKVSKADILNYKSAPIPDSENTRHMFLMAPIPEAKIVKTDEVAETGYFNLSTLPETKFQGHIKSAAEFVRMPL